MSELIFTTHDQQRNHEVEIAKELKLDVKNVKFFKGHDGMTGINADIYYNGKKFAHAYDDARGGEMEIYAVSGDKRPILQMVIEQLSKYPSYKVEFDRDINGRSLGGDVLKYESRPELSSIVDYLAQAKEEERIRKRDRSKGILYTNPKGEELLWGWKEAIPAVLKKFPKQARKALQENYDKLIKEGCVVHNADYLKELGIKV